MSEPWYLVADIGGTNTRFSAFQGAKLQALTVYDTKQGGALLAMAQEFCQQNFPTPPLLAVAAAAGPVENNALKLTNADQSLCGTDLAATTGAQRAFVINDFSAAAWSTLALGPEEMQVLHDVEADATGNRLVIGPGTGLGVGALIYSEGGFHSVSGEGGHVGLSPRNGFEVELFKALRSLWPEVFFGDALTVEAEALLSGTGLPYLYCALQKVECQTGEPLTPHEILNTAFTATNPVAIKAVEIFKSRLAQVAGDLALTFGASGGIYFVGGIATKNPWIFDETFLSGLHDGGRFSSQREKFRVNLVTSKNFGLIGARKFAEVKAMQADGYLHQQ